MHGIKSTKLNTLPSMLQAVIIRLIELLKKGLFFKANPFFCRPIKSMFGEKIWEGEEEYFMNKLHKFTHLLLVHWCMPPSPLCQPQQLWINTKIHLLTGRHRGHRGGKKHRRNNRSYMVELLKDGFWEPISSPNFWVAILMFITQLALRRNYINLIESWCNESWRCVNWCFFHTPFDETHTHTFRR